jgi:hypothetical protein
MKMFQNVLVYVLILFQGINRYLYCIIYLYNKIKMATKIKITEEQLKRIIKAKNIQEQQAAFGFAKESNEEEENEESTHESIEKIADLFCELFADKCKDPDYIDGIFSLAKSSILSGDSDSEEDEKEEEGKEEEKNEIPVMGGEEKEDEEEEEGEEADEEEEEENNMMNESVQKIKADFKRFL